MRTIQTNCPFCGADHRPSEPHQPRPTPAEVLDTDALWALLTGPRR